MFFIKLFLFLSPLIYINLFLYSSELPYNLNNEPNLSLETSSFGVSSHIPATAAKPTLSEWVAENGIVAKKIYTVNLDLVHQKFNEFSSHEFDPDAPLWQKKIVVRAKELKHLLTSPLPFQHVHVIVPCRMKLTALHKIFQKYF